MGRLKLFVNISQLHQLQYKIMSQRKIRRVALLKITAKFPYHRIIVERRNFENYHVCCEGCDIRPVSVAMIDRWCHVWLTRAYLPNAQQVNQQARRTNPRHCQASTRPPPEALSQHTPSPCTSMPPQPSSCSSTPLELPVRDLPPIRFPAHLVELGEDVAARKVTWNYYWV